MLEKRVKPNPGILFCKDKRQRSSGVDFKVTCKNQVSYLKTARPKWSRKKEKTNKQTKKNT